MKRRIDVVKAVVVLHDDIAAKCDELERHGGVCCYGCADGDLCRVGDRITDELDALLGIREAFVREANGRRDHDRWNHHSRRFRYG